MQIFFPFAALLALASAQQPVDWTCRKTKFFPQGVCQDGRGGGQTCDSYYYCINDNDICYPYTGNLSGQNAQCSQDAPPRE